LAGIWGRAGAVMTGIGARSAAMGNCGEHPHRSGERQCVEQLSPGAASNAPPPRHPIAPQPTEPGTTPGPTARPTLPGTPTAAAPAAPLRSAPRPRSTPRQSAACGWRCGDAQRRVTSPPALGRCCHKGHRQVRADGAPVAAVVSASLSELDDESSAQESATNAGLVRRGVRRDVRIHIRKLVGRGCGAIKTHHNPRNTATANRQPSRTPPRTSPRRASAPLRGTLT
jgi:hypothetical protein